MKMQRWHSGAIWGALYKHKAVASDLSHTAGQTVKSRRQFAQTWRSRLLDSELQLLRCEDPDCWTLSSICLKFIPRKWSEAMFQDVCKKMCLVPRQRQRKRGRRKRRGKESCQKLQLQGSSWSHYVPFISWIIKQSLNSIITMTVD